MAASPAPTTIPSGKPSPLTRHWSISRAAEVDRGAKVVSVFPDSAAVLRLATAVLQEQRVEWQDGRRYFPRTSLAQLFGEEPPALSNPLTAGRAA